MEIDARIRLLKQELGTELVGMIESIELAHESIDIDSAACRIAETLAKLVERQEVLHKRKLAKGSRDRYARKHLLSES